MASIGEWVVGVFVNFTGNGVREMQRLSLAASSVNDQLKRQQGLLTADQAALNRYNRQMEEIALRRQRLIGNVAGTIAVAGVAAMGDAVTQAAKLQTIFVAIQNATGATAEQMDRYSQRFYDIADRNGMAVQDAADIVRVFARASGGRLSLAQLVDLADKGGAQFSMIMKNARGEDYETSATQAITLAHMFRAYDPAGQAKMFDAMAHLGEMMPHNLNAAITQMGYFLPKLKTMGVDDASAVALMAWMDQSGYGRGKGGTGLRTLVEQGLGPLQLTTHAQGVKAVLLREMGLIDAHGNSPFYDAKTKSFNIFGYLGAIHDWVAKQPRMDTALKTITSTFGTQGGNIAALMADPAVVAGLQELRRFSTDSRVSQREQAARYENTVMFQAGRAWSNFQSLMTELAFPWLQQATNLLRSLGGKLHALQVYFHGHRDIEKSVGVVVASVTTVAAALAGLGLIAKIGGVAAGGGAASSVFMGALGWLDAVLFRGILSKVVLGVLDLVGGRGIFAFLGRFIPVVGWVTAALEGLNLFVHFVENLPTIVTAIHNWWAKWQGPIGYTINWVFFAITKMLVDAIQLMFTTIASVVATAAHNLWLLGSISGQAQLAELMAESAVQAQRDWDRSHHESFTSGTVRAFNDVFGPGGMKFNPIINVNVSGQNVRVDSVTMQHGSNVSGSIKTSPIASRAAAALGIPIH